MFKRWILVFEQLRRVHRRDFESLLSSVTSNRTVCTSLESEQFDSSSNLNEGDVLAELSTLLPISIAKEDKTRIDSYLSPEEKLRGVFLQKLKGKSAIQNSLSNLNIDLSIEIVANFVNQGNLSGESMVTFFNWAINEPNISKDVNAYYCVILKALGRRKYFTFMTDILQGMVKPNLQCLTIAIDSFVKANYVRRAIELFEESECSNSTESLNALLKCLCERSHVTAANSVFNSKKGKVGFDSFTYNIMINGWSKLGEIEQIENIMKEMSESGICPSCLSYSYLIEGLGRSGRSINDSVEVFDSLKHKDVNVYNAMIVNLIFARDYDESIRYYKMMLEEGCEPDFDTYSKLVSGLIKGRKVSDALEIFDEMLSRKNVALTTGFVTSLIKPLCSYGPPHAAMVIYEKSKKSGCKISETSYKLLLKRLSKFGKCGMLLNVWDEMQECGYLCDVEVYEYIVDGLCTVGHLENAVLVMEEATRKGFCPNRLVYSRLSNKLMASNKTELAYKLFMKMKEARVKDNARRYWRRNGWHF